MISVTIPVRTVSEANGRGHSLAKAPRVRAHREAVALMLPFWVRNTPVAPPYLVTLRRVAPRKNQIKDDDNLSSSMKAVRDQVAKELGVNDGDRARIQFVYEQKVGPFAVEVVIVTG